MNLDPNLGLIGFRAALSPKDFGMGSHCRCSMVKGKKLLDEKDDASRGGKLQKVHCSDGYEWGYQMIT